MLLGVALFVATASEYEQYQNNSKTVSMKSSAPPLYIVTPWVTKKRPGENNQLIALSQMLASVCICTRDRLSERTMKVLVPTIINSHVHETTHPGNPYFVSARNSTEGNIEIFMELGQRRKFGQCELVYLDALDRGAPHWNTCMATRESKSAAEFIARLKNALHAKSTIPCLSANLHDWFNWPHAAQDMSTELISQPFFPFQKGFTDMVDARRKQITHGEKQYHVIQWRKIHALCKMKYPALARKGFCDDSAEALHRFSEPLRKEGLPIFVLTIETRPADLSKLKAFGFRLFDNPILKNDEGGTYADNPTQFTRVAASPSLRGVELDPDFQLAVEMSATVHADRVMLNPASSFKYMIMGLRSLSNKSTGFIGLPTQNARRANLTKGCGAVLNT
jgi:hypothetical protein